MRILYPLHENVEYARMMGSKRTERVLSDARPFRSDFSPER